MRALRAQDAHRPGVLPGERHIDDIAKHIVPVL